MLEERLVALKRELMEYTGLVEGMVEKSIKGLLQKERDLLVGVIEEDEPKANKVEIELDELCTTLIAQYEPKAKNLRTILMILKMNNDLERMADHAVNIAQAAQFLIDRPLVKPWIDVPRMADVAIGMLKDSVAAFIDEDAKLAKGVCLRDDTVDGLRNQLLRELITFMSSDPTTIERSLQLIRISSNLERIADLSTNICEDVIFVAEGTVIKHHEEEWGVRS
jgi:phosphate transport system protein